MASRIRAAADTARSKAARLTALRSDASSRTLVTEYFITTIVLFLMSLVIDRYARPAAATSRALLDEDGPWS
jgi:hypothetical protein